MKEFFGIGGYQRTPEGYFSWQHLGFVTSLMVLMIGLAVLFGLRNREKDAARKNRVLIVAAILMDSLEIFKIVILCLRGDDPIRTILLNLPLFMCSIQLISLPLAAFTRGRLKAAALDFVFIFGILGAVFGTYFAGQNYACYPVLSLDNVFSGVTHTIAGFASLYIAVSGMLRMEKRNIFITFSIITGFCAAALVADYTIPYNYMFLKGGDGTPYDIFYKMLGENWLYQTIIYPIIVLLLFYLYIAAFYGAFFLIQHIREKKAAKKQQ
ncbi:MAG: hypothetical protein E7680_00465 [Ruminococcaceae bacterium]|nr:hypothetical protein [Oscillospiraceae bacterium]